MSGSMLTALRLTGTHRGGGGAVDWGGFVRAGDLKVCVLCSSWMDLKSGFNAQRGLNGS